MGTLQPVNLVYWLAILGMLATILTLFNGVLSMTEEHSADPHYSERLMFKRVGLQAATVALVIAALLM